MGFAPSIEKITLSIKDFFGDGFNLAWCQNETVGVCSNANRRTCTTNFPQERNCLLVEKRFSKIEIKYPFQVGQLSNHV